MIRHSLFAAAVLWTLGSASASAQTIYAGNQSTGFGGALGQSTLSISDNASTGVVSFSLALGNGNTSFNDAAFYFSTGSGGVSNTSDVTDTADEGRRSISGDSTVTGRSLVNFANGFSAKYAVALDANGNANLFQLVPGQGYLTYLSGANSTHTSGTNVYGFSINESQLGLTAGSGASFSFVATLSNANQDYNNNNTGGGFYRSNETIGASNVDNNAQGNLANTGTLTYSGFDTYITAVPEPATWLGAVFCVALLGGKLVSRRRSTAAI